MKSKVKLIPALKAEKINKDELDMNDLSDMPDLQYFIWHGKLYMAPLDTEYAYDVLTGDSIICEDERGLIDLVNVEIKWTSVKKEK